MQSGDAGLNFSVQHDMGEAYHYVITAVAQSCIENKNSTSLKIFSPLLSLITKL
jgi:hypothetical protein